MTIDRLWMEAVLIDLLRADTQVPLGETEILPGDSRIMRTIDNVLIPRIEELHPDEVRRHAKGDVAARFGPAGDDGLLIQTYVVSQHANLMEDPNAGTITDGAPYSLQGRCGVGRGATQNKGPMASAFAAVRSMPRDAQRPVWLSVNTEGRSSHGGSHRVITDLGLPVAHGIIAFGTDLGVSLGNRGRVDLRVTVPGRSCHSSQPWLGENPIEGAADVIQALRTVSLPEAHPDLGHVTITPYQFSCFPVAPHTIPERVDITVDRRLLPGETPEVAGDELRAHLSDARLNVEIQEGAWMLPAAVEPDEPVVGYLLEGVERQGREARTFWSPNTFDAGYACSLGIPTPMFGPGKREFKGEGLMGTDAVSVDDCEVAAGSLLHAAEMICT